MSRLTTDNIKGMMDLAYNQFFVKDHLAIHRDFEREIDCRDLAREIVKNLKIEYVSEEFFTDDDFFDDEIMEWLQFGTNDVMGVIAMYYMAMWGMATVRDSLKEYEDIGSTPSQLKEIDKLYLEKCHEVNKLKEQNLTEPQMIKLCTILTHYEKLLEEKRVIEIPLKVGDTIYEIFNNEIYEYQSYEITYDSYNKRFCYDNLDISLDEIGKTVFLTKAEAEKAMAESEG